MTTHRKEIRSYTIRTSRLSESQRRCLCEYYPLYGISFPCELDWKEIFPSFKKTVVEIGCGNGQATIEIAKNKQDTAFVGIEVHRSGLGQLLRAIHHERLSNLKVIQYDAVPVVKSLPSNSVDGFHIFFPDPWPKKRHHKRRLLQKPFLEEIARTLKQGGYFYFASDWEEYALEVKNMLLALPYFQNQYDSWAKDIFWRPQTRFEDKGIKAKRMIRELFFVKRS